MAALGTAQKKASGMLSKLRSDANFARAGTEIVRATRAVRGRAGSYFARKLPILQWLPSYSPSWILEDLIAGASVGILMIPQAVFFAPLVGLSVPQVLMSGMIPGVLYSLLGSSRGMFAVSYCWLLTQVLNHHAQKT